MLERVKRRFLLRMLARQTPQSLLARAERDLPAVLDSAARRSRAYQQLLQEAGVAPPFLRGADALDMAPVLNKQSTFERFGLHELLATNVAVESLASVLTSSGYGSASFGFGLSDRKEQSSTPAAIDLGLQNAFGIDDRTTLLINCLPMGVFFESHTACVSNVSVREDMALAILRQAGPSFEQIILLVDPLFAKRFLDYAENQGFDLGAQRVQMILGEETFQEPFRDYLRTRLGLSLEEVAEQPFLGSSMGVGELGLNIFFETPETVALRRALQRANPWQRQPVFFCFNPLRSWVEVHEPDDEGMGELLITMMDRNATIPLPRYSTGDQVAWVDKQQLEAVPEAVRAGIRALPFPLLALHGRKRDQLSPTLHIDDLKFLQYQDTTTARQLSGAFRAEQRSQGFHWHLQCASDAATAPSQLEKALRELFHQRCAALGHDVNALAELRVFPYAEFPYGMSLDYERKFRYAGTVA